jgi:hypothetical protein
MSQDGFQSRFLGQTRLSGNGWPEGRRWRLLLFGSKNGKMRLKVRHSDTQALSQRGSYGY